MIFLYISLLILAGLMGIHGGIVTVSRVPVKAGDSISIPCLYEQIHKNHEKYLCQGRYFFSCSIVIRTNQPKSSSGRFSISDDTNKGIFTVTINDLTEEDSHRRYWCAVEIENSWDVHELFRLSVTTRGTPSLYVEQQEVAAFERGSVTVRCHHKYATVKKWCRLGRSCLMGQTGSMEGTKVTISASAPNVYTVTMSGLRTESSGWYLCDVEDVQMPVHITVHELTTTATTAVSSNTANNTQTLPTTTQLSSLVTREEPHTAQPTNSTITVMAGESVQEHKSSTLVTILISTLVLLLLVVLAVCFGWRMIIRRNKTKPEGSDSTADSGQVGSVPDLHYATIVRNQHAASQRKRTIPEENVTCSTIAQQMTEPVDGSVIYSKLLKQNIC